VRRLMNGTPHDAPRPRHRRRRSPARGHRAQIGDNELFALIDLAGRAHVGTQAELSSIVKLWVHQIDLPLTKMNFARFCGETSLAEKAASEAVKAKVAEFGDRKTAIIWFINSVIVADLLNALTSRAKDSSHAEAFLEHIQVVVRFDRQRISVELPKSILERQESTRYRKDLAKLLEFARKATQCEIDLIDDKQSRPAVDSQRPAAQRVTSLIEEIRRIPRQEERIAVIMRTLLTEAPAGFDVLHR
jgi:hypothetical protein